MPPWSLHIHKDLTDQLDLQSVAKCFISKSDNQWGFSAGKGTITALLHRHSSDWQNGQAKHCVGDT